MAHVILFHHALGLTDGVHRFADHIRAAGHDVDVPDLYEGQTFATVEEGVAHAERIGFDVIIERGLSAASKLTTPTPCVYAGMSLGAMPAQKLAQTVPGVAGAPAVEASGRTALAAILYHATAPPAAFSPHGWPTGVALQMHLNRHDRWAAEDLQVAEQLARTSPDAELFIYEGSTHLFTDSSLSDYDEPAARLALQRTLRLLSRWL
jgi:dienelactone hydrolase